MVRLPRNDAGLRPEKTPSVRLRFIAVGRRLARSGAAARCGRNNRGGSPMEREHEDLLEYESPTSWEETEVESGAMLSLVALLAMIVLPAAALVFVWVVS